MASKRTRSITRRLAEGSSSNVTDYMGPSKRQKRANTENGRVTLDQPDPPKVTRSGTVRREAYAQKPAAIRQRTQPSPVNEEADEDEPVNVNFNTIASASNEARRTRPRTVNGVRVAETQIASDRAASSGEGDDEPQDEARGNGVNAHPALRPLRKRLSRPLNSTQKKNRSQRAEQQRREQNNDDTIRHDLYEFMSSSSESPARSQQKGASGGRSDTRRAGTPRRTRRQQGKSGKSGRRRKTLQRVEQDGATSESNEDGADDGLVDIGEDSAFIEAPRSDEELATVEVTINSLGGIIGTLSHAAWTGSGRWHASFDTARGGIQDNVEKCRTALGRSLIKHAKDLKAIFDKAAAVATEKEGCDGDYEETIHYLREHSKNVGSHFASIDTLITKICTEGLASNDDPAGKAIKARRQLLRDISQRLIPMIVLVIQATCSLGPSEERRGKVHLQLSSFTLQFFLRTVGWARRLERALTRGLEQWAFDPEFRQDEEQLDNDQVKSKDAKRRSREALDKQLSALQYKAKEAERAIQKQARDAAQEELRRHLRHRQLVQEKTLAAANQREQAEMSRSKAQRWEAFCRSTQALKYAKDPMKERWDVAEKARLQFQASHQPAMQNLAQNAQRVESTSSHAPAPQEASPPGKPWGLDWTPAEEKALLKAIRYNQDYHVVPMAAQLRRAERDVARKAAAVKEAYRSLYRERGRSIPNWAF